jgi:hypothetical protein
MNCQVFDIAVCSTRPELRRDTPYLYPHSTAIAGLRNTRGGDNRFYNNIFVGKSESSTAVNQTAADASQSADGHGLRVYDARKFPLQIGGNVYCNGARPYSAEMTAVPGKSDPKIELLEDGEDVYFRATLGQAVQKTRATLVTTDLLGVTKIANVSFENPDGSPLSIDTDYFGESRNEVKPTPGLFENPATGPLTLKVW